MVEFVKKPQAAEHLNNEIGGDGVSAVSPYHSKEIVEDVIHRQFQTKVILIHIAIKSLEVVFIVSVFHFLFAPFLYLFSVLIIPNCLVKPVVLFVLFTTLRCNHQIRRSRCHSQSTCGIPTLFS